MLDRQHNIGYMLCERQVATGQGQRKQRDRRMIGMRNGGVEHNTGRGLVLQQLHELEPAGAEPA